MLLECHDLQIRGIMSKLVQGPVGNYYDKFNSHNPVARRLMVGFMQSFYALYARIQVKTVLEIGCGEGYMLNAMKQYKAVKFHGFDLDIPLLQEAQANNPLSHLTMMDGHHIAYASDTFDLVVATEVLEHVLSPAKVLAEAQRVSSQYAIFSVPREPIWRILNMMRGKYWGDFGNTPGHIQHWSTDTFIALVEQHFRVIEVYQPFPWTMLLCELP
jgi:2-polyprenyl-3-methyl-5-hydroxy-6-metoxy-1,4-benzoquinol methylase